MTNGLLLWADDEMELLRPHLLFLEKKGYEVVTVTNGIDAIEECRKQTFDLVLLDEMMPGGRTEYCRLPHQTRQPQPDTAHPEEAHPQAGDCGRGDPDRLPAAVPATQHADDGL